jgi:hypothetical protein
LIHISIVRVIGARAIITASAEQINLDGLPGVDPEQPVASGCFAVAIFKSTKSSVAIGRRSVGNIRIDHGYRRARLV